MAKIVETFLTKIFNYGLKWSKILQNLPNLVNIWVEKGVRILSKYHSVVSKARNQSHWGKYSFLLT